MLTKLAMISLTVLLFSCGVRAVGDAGGGFDAGIGDGGVESDAVRGLPPLVMVDRAAASRGEAFLRGHHVGGGLVPLLAMRNLWIVWGGAPPATDAAYWAAFRDRYGLLAADGEALPLGLHVIAATQEVAFDCLTCHVAEVEGRQYLGGPNVRFDLQGLFDDLATLAQRAPLYGFPVSPLPWTITGRSQAAGANDAMGLGFQLAARWAPGVAIDDTQGFQRPQPWWTLRHKRWHYVDGSGPAGGYRTMMATLLASRMTLGELQAQDAEFADLAQYLLSLEAPRWPWEPPDGALVSRGQALFEARCASCHGTYDGPARVFPDKVVPWADVGTDATRATSLGAAEASFVNATWFGANAPMRTTGGYLAPDLTGVWATAPYFHNGSVPTLAAVLDSSKRPAAFRLSTTWNRDDVGWDFVVAAPAGQATLEARRVFDTHAPGLSNAGHVYGDALTADERRAVLEYLKTL